MVESPKTYYFINDHLGSSQQLVDKDRQVVWQGAYSPFGSLDVVVNRVSNNFRFPGQYFDSETGLHYNWHRFYDPDTGRYISADPIGLQGGINLYAYVRNDPVNWVDPWGLAKIVNGGIKPSIKGPYKSTLQKGIDAADKFVGNKVLNKLGVPTPVAKGVLGSTLGLGVGAILLELTNPTTLGDGTLPPDWDQDRNGIPDLIEPLPNDDC